MPIQQMTFPTSALIVALAVTATVQTAPARQPPAAPDLQRAWPAARGGHGMAYDARRGMTLVYGDRGPEAAVLWGWDGVRWHSFTAPGPGLRRHIKLAYDSARERTVLFGGVDDSGNRRMGDTWEWDGQQWQQVATEGPEPRGSYSMAYDPARRRVMLFGGLSDAGTMGDTWEWDGRRWQKRTDAGPTPRGEAGAVYLRGARHIVIAGGTTWTVATVNGRRDLRPAPKTERPRDTWAWDGQAWQKLADDAVARFGPLVSDPLSGAPLRIGGESDVALHGDILRWTGGVWTALTAPPIPSRFFHEAALDTRRKRVVVFGGSPGNGALADLWEWDGRQWREIEQPPRH